MVILVFGGVALSEKEMAMECLGRNGSCTNLFFGSLEQLCRYLSYFSNMIAKFGVSKNKFKRYVQYLLYFRYPSIY